MSWIDLLPSLLISNLQSYLISPIHLVAMLPIIYHHHCYLLPPISSLQSPFIISNPSCCNVDNHIFVSLITSAISNLQSPISNLHLISPFLTSKVAMLMIIYLFPLSPLLSPISNLQLGILYFDYKVQSLRQ